MKLTLLQNKFIYVYSLKINIFHFFMSSFTHKFYFIPHSKPYSILLLNPNLQISSSIFVQNQFPFPTLSSSQKYDLIIIVFYSMMTRDIIINFTLFSLNPKTCLRDFLFVAMSLKAVNLVYPKI